MTSTPSDKPPSTPPTAREIADLTARLRILTDPAHRATPTERAAFLADKAALLARIPHTHRPADKETDPR